MRPRRLPGSSAPRLELGPPVRTSYARLAIADGVAVLGVVSVLCGAIGVFDDGGDALVLVPVGLVAFLAGRKAHTSLSRRIRPAPGRVLSGLALSWLVLVLLGAGIYLTTGTIDRLDEALVESAAGFSTTALTTLDPTELSDPMQLWRAATQWIGGLVGIIVGVIAIPLAFRGSQLDGTATKQTSDRLAPNPAIGRRRVALLYTSLTLGLMVAYLVTGLGGRDAAVHAMTTASTGGFSSFGDSFAGLGSGPRVVATVGMAIAGSSFFVLWWVVRGRLRPVWRSTELRLYLGLLAAGSVALTLAGEGIGVGDAIFTTTSALSTTGYAIGDWTVLGDAVLMLLLVLIGTGSMSSSAGGGLRVARAWTLVGFASRELRRQLDPHSIVVVKQGGSPIDERTLERATGYQIGHLGLSAVAALLLAAGGVDLVGAIFTGVSVLSTHGPGVGVGPHGDISEWSTAARLLLIPFMLAGRMTILPLLLAISGLFTARDEITRRSRRIARKVWSR